MDLVGSDHFKHCSRVGLECLAGNSALVSQVLLVESEYLYLVDLDADLIRACILPVPGVIVYFEVQLYLIIQQVALVSHLRK